MLEIWQLVEVHFVVVWSLETLQYKVMLDFNVFHYSSIEAFAIKGNIQKLMVSENVFDDYKTLKAFT